MTVLASCLSTSNLAPEMGMSFGKWTRSKARNIVDMDWSAVLVDIGDMSATINLSIM